MKKDYEVDWESSHSTVVKANSKEEAIEIVRELADREQSFIQIIDGPFATNCEEEKIMKECTKIFDRANETPNRYDYEY